MTVSEFRPQAIRALEIRYNDLVAETFVGRLRTGPAGAIAFSLVPGIIVVADPCGPVDALEVRIAWQVVGHDDLDCIFPMLQALFGVSVARAALQRFDSSVAVHGGYHTRRSLRRLVQHVDAMERDHDSEFFAGVWGAEAEALAAAIDSRIPLSAARRKWRLWANDLDDDLKATLAAAQDGKSTDGAGLAQLTRYAAHENAESIVKWCQITRPSTNRPDIQAANAIAAGMLALRIERLGCVEFARTWWNESGVLWAAQGDRQRATIAAERAKSSLASAAVTASFAEVHSAVYGFASWYGYLPAAASGSR
ncbi:MAG: hypothetical protein JO074_06190 [Frankiales bacterium]|nr:hypothetical protein [Frankiales bacterium]